MMDGAVVEGVIGVQLGGGMELGENVELEEVVELGEDVELGEVMELGEVVQVEGGDGLQDVDMELDLSPALFPGLLLPSVLMLLLMLPLFTMTSGPHLELSDHPQPVDFLDEFLDEDLHSLVVHETNQ